MKVTIDDTCTACGLCVSLSGSLCNGRTIAYVLVDEVPAEFEDAVQQAADECPVEAIHVE